ncbi:MAG: cation:proton antiporter [Alphaproteobacteria bacterium]|nr:cation:proton antiporter [Alphaproteobacteria bacterium]
MHAIHPLIIDLTLISIYAAIITLICKKLKQPTVLGYVLAGILAGPFLSFVPTVSDKANLTLWADIGVIFLLFGLGLEFSFKKMINVGKSALITSNANIFFMLFLGYNTGLLLGWSVMDSFFLGSMISMSSTTIIIKAFEDLNIKKQKFTDLVFGVLVVEDLVGILLLVLLPTIALGNAIDSKELLLSTAKLLFFLVLCFVIGIYLVPSFLKKITPLLNDEMLLIISIGLCFSMVLLATSFGFSSALGAFLMGSILAETAVIERIEKNMKPLKDFFGVVFFVSVGMMVDPSMFIKYAWPILVITIIVIIGKVIFSCFGFLFSGETLKTSLHGGFSLAQVGEFAFIIASLGMSLGVLSDQVYPTIVAVSVITTFLTPMMIKAAGPAYKYLKKALPDSISKKLEHTAIAKETKIEEQHWKLLFKNYFIRLSLFSMILYTVIIVSTYFIKPFIHGLMPNLPARITVTVITLLLMAPFLKAMIGWETILPIFVREKIAQFLCVFTHEDKKDEKRKSVISKIEEKLGICSIYDKAIEEKNFFISNHSAAAVYYKLWTAKKINRIPLIVMTSFRLVMVLFAISTVVHLFLTENPKVTWGLVIISIMVLSQSKWLFNQYMKIEKQFLTNLKGDRKVVEDSSLTNESAN